MKYATRTTVQSYRSLLGDIALPQECPSHPAALTHETLHEVADYLQYHGLTVSPHPDARMPRCWVGMSNGADLSEVAMGHLRSLAPEAFVGVRERERLALLSLPGSLEENQAAANQILNPHSWSPIEAAQIQRIVAAMKPEARQ